MDERTVITIGREFGSGGHEIGMKLAEKLGIKCYDKELHFGFSEHLSFIFRGILIAGLPVI